MENYTITINGKAYAVTIEEGAASGIATAPAAPVAAPAAPTVPAAAPALTAAPAGTTGPVSVSAPMPGRVVAVKAAARQTMKKGGVVLVLEVMKTENGIMTPQDGTIASINAPTGDSVESGTVLAVLN